MINQIYKASEWDNCGWHCGSVQDLGNCSGAWWMPARAMGITLPDFVQTLKDYGADIRWDDKYKFLHYSWKDYNKCHKFLLMLNKTARNRGFKI